MILIILMIELKFVNKVKALRKSQGHFLYINLNIKYKKK